MDKEIKKKLASNWFKLLQNTICNDIEKLEGKKFKFKSKTWNRNEIKDEEYTVVHALDILAKF